MKHPSSAMATWARWLPVLVVTALSVGCADTDDERPANYQYNATPASLRTATDGCAVAIEGCPCRTPGEIVDCGKITVKVDGYETCYDGSRICTEAGVWSACAADQAIARLAS